MTKPSQVPGLGARTSFRTAAEKLLHARLADLRAAETRALHRCDASAVHALRVACRRLRAAIKLFGKKRLRALDDRVEHLQDTLGDVRDLQLQVRWLSRHHADPSKGRKKLQAAQAHLRKALALWSRRSEPLLLREATRVHGGGSLGGARARKRLRKRLRDLRREMRNESTLDPAVAHRIRIAAKKLRYEAELLRDAFDLGEAVATLADVQSTLGDLHDADVRLREVGKDKRLSAAARADRRRGATRARAALRRLSRMTSSLEQRL
jgi:CHAD domain-containing protein